MEIRPIRNNEDYEAALLEVAPYFEGDEPDLDSLDGQRFDVLVTLIESYEAKHFPVDLPDPIEAIKFCMDQQGLTPKDLVPMIGRVNRVYEILNGKRQLTLAMIRQLHQRLGIPLSSLINLQQDNRLAA